MTRNNPQTAPEKDHFPLGSQRSTDLSDLQRPTQTRRAPCSGCHGEGKRAFKNPIYGTVLAVVVTGFNDVVGQLPSHRAVAAREALANWLRNGCGVQHVMFAPLPPVHHFPGLPQPLRWVAGADARRHNLALQQWAAWRNDVSCVDMEMPLNRGVMASDGFHPGEPVYRYCAGAIAQHIAIRVWPQVHFARCD